MEFGCNCTMIAVTYLNYQNPHVHEDFHILAAVKLKPTISKGIKDG